MDLSVPVRTSAAPSSYAKQKILIELWREKDKMYQIEAKIGPFLKMDIAV